MIDAAGAADRSVDRGDVGGGGSIQDREAIDIWFDLSPEACHLCLGEGCAVGRSADIGSRVGLSSGNS